jgi:hypothetical protein
MGADLCPILDLDSGTRIVDRGLPSMFPIRRVEMIDDGRPPSSEATAEKGLRRVSEEEVEV